MKVLLFLFLGFLCVLGFADLIRAAVFRLFRLPREDLFFVARLKNADSAEQTVRAVLERVKWLNAPARLVFLYRPGDEETKTIAEKIISNYPGIGLSSGDDLNYNIIQEDLQI